MRHAALTAIALAACAAIPSAGCTSGTPGPHVLTVGIYNGTRGEFTSIQAAVSAARPGDTILVAPGDYRESPTASQGILITTSRLHIRGLDRQGVIVDGTRPGSGPACSPTAADQNRGTDGTGRNGIVIRHATGVSIENLTVCNFVGAADANRHGNQIWIDGGAASGRSTRGSYEIRDVDVTSTYLAPATSTGSDSQARTGILISNSSGPGTVTDSAGANMADSAFHIAGCADCDAAFDRLDGTHNVIGFSATDAGGRLTLRHSTFTDNSAGINVASENNEDAPPPQDGSCPAHHRGPEALDTTSCTVIADNTVGDNNDPNVPGGNGSGALAFLGAGIDIAGGHHDTVVRNTVTDQGAYGIVVTVSDIGSGGYPNANCQGGRQLAAKLCFFNGYANTVADNHLGDNGTFANPTNGDLADVTTTHAPGNCFTGNSSSTGAGHALSATPADLQRPGPCSPQSGGGAVFGAAGVQVACATRAFGPCSTESGADVLTAIAALAAALGNASAISTTALATVPARYPANTTVTTIKLARHQGLSAPCAGISHNAWC